MAEPEDKSGAIILRSDSPLANELSPPNKRVFQLTQYTRVQEVAQELRNKRVLCTADDYCSEVDKAALQQLADNHQRLLRKSQQNADLFFAPEAFEQNQLEKGRVEQVSQFSDDKDTYIGWYPLSFHSVRELTAADAHELGHIAWGDTASTKMLLALEQAGLLTEDTVNSIRRAQETRADAYAVCLTNRPDLEKLSVEQCSRSEGS